MGLFGIKIPKNCSKEKAHELLERAWELYDHGKPDKAVEIFAPLAEQGFAEAQNALGICYKNGNGVPQDVNLAFRWFGKASEQGYGAASYNLGKLFENGKYVEKDEKRMFNYYIKGASQGYVKAIYETGCCYAFGTGTETNLLYAVSQWITAALKGNTDADQLLKSAVLDPAYETLAKDYLLPYLNQRPEADGCAIMLIGHCYEFGIGVECDLQMAQGIYMKGIMSDNKPTSFERKLIDSVKKMSNIIK